MNKTLDVSLYLQSSEDNMTLGQTGVHIEGNVHTQLSPEMRIQALLLALVQSNLVLAHYAKEAYEQRQRDIEDNIKDIQKKIDESN